MTKNVNIFEVLARLVILRVKKFLDFWADFAYVMVRFMLIGLPGAIVGFLYAWFNAADLLKYSLTGGMGSFMLVAIGYGIYTWVKKFRKDFDTCKEDAE